jgi:hypothetical protein
MKMRRKTAVISAVSVAALAIGAGFTGSASAATGTTGAHPHTWHTASGATHVTAGGITNAHASGVSGGVRVKSTGTFADTETLNWSGYVSDNGAGNDNSVGGIFTAPFANACATASDGAVSIWYGLDGFNGSTVEQAGIQAQCVDGSTEYYPWIETYPAPEEELVSSATGDPLPVDEYDHILVGVVEDSPTVYDITITDIVQGWSYSADVTMPSGYSGADASAEAIVEAPSETGVGQLPLAEFDPTSFIAGEFNGGTSFTNADAVHMYPNGTTEADTVTDLDPTGNFAVVDGGPKTTVLLSTYQAEVAEYNEEVARYNAEVSSDESEVSKYNAEVKKYNAEVKKYDGEASVVSKDCKTLKAHHLACSS